MSVGLIALSLWPGVSTLATDLAEGAADLLNPRRRPIGEGLSSKDDRFDGIGFELAAGRGEDVSDGACDADDD